MNITMRSSILASAALIAVAFSGTVQAQQAGPSPEMSFFVTSTAVGKGGDLGGIEGADAHCQQLAAAVGAGGKTWHAYLSSPTVATNPGATINARDRIGRGPWKNFRGVVIATSVEDLHSDANKITKETGLTEKGTVVNGVGDTPNQHDILTGSDMQGRAFPDNVNLTCNGWKSSQYGTAIVGHVDRRGNADTVYQHSWVSAHLSRGCTQPDLIATGGNGYLYCFAINP
jgi:hypothetical protein